jgi:hypothetical protein
MNIVYVVTPFVAWSVAGGLKFVVNSVRARKLAFRLIGYGGLPSNHASIVTSVVAVIIAREGLDAPALVVAVGLAFIVLLDAKSLRGQVGKHAVAINALAEADGRKPLRERIGHTPIELLAGIVVGALVGAGLGLFWP